MRLRADFNEVDGNTIWISLRRQGYIPSGEPYVGQHVTLYDHDGNRCIGLVTAVQEPIAFLEIDLSTWADSEEVQVPKESPVATAQRTIGRLIPRNRTERREWTKVPA
jgi:hypothetical protein